jgi:hypothetical protein
MDFMSVCTIGWLQVANGPVDPEAVAAGNEAVLRARFEDAAFFYREDLKQQLANFRWAAWGFMNQHVVSSVPVRCIYDPHLQ